MDKGKGIKRKRAANWDKLEKDLLRNCIKEWVSIIENKNTDTNTNKLKNNAWEKITQRFNELNTRERSMLEIKQQWRTTKLEAKKVVSDYKREQSGTGGGPKPPSPSQDIIEVVDMIPQEFEVDSNLYDSDGIVIIPKDPEACSQTSDAIFDSMEVYQIQSPANKENIQQITTPLASIHIENLGGSNKPQAAKKAAKRKLPFKTVNNDMAMKRTEILTNCVTDEHNLKMQQMRESHEWARAEHQLRLENLKLENLLLKSKKENETISK